MSLDNKHTNVLDFKRQHKVKLIQRFVFNVRCKSRTKNEDVHTEAKAKKLCHHCFNLIPTSILKVSVKTRWTSILAFSMVWFSHSFVPYEGWQEETTNTEQTMEFGGEKQNQMSCLLLFFTWASKPFGSVPLSDPFYANANRQWCWENVSFILIHILTFLPQSH